MNTVPGVTFDVDGSLRTFGTRVGTHDVILDGAALTDQLYGGGSVTRPPSLDSIQEFHVEVNSSSAKFTRQTSIIMTTKGGTNEIHGSLFETNRDNGYGVARARDNFTNTAAKLIRNEYGGTVGGPVFIPKLYNGKNRTFWFFSYEGYKLRSGGFGNYRVPTEAMRNGDFSGLVDSAGTCIDHLRPADHRRASYQRLPFNYGGKVNNIDPARISPLMKYIYSVLPMPNIPNVNPLVGHQLQRSATPQRRPVHLVGALRPPLLAKRTWSTAASPTPWPPTSGPPRAASPRWTASATPAPTPTQQEPVARTGPTRSRRASSTSSCSAPAGPWPPTSPAIPAASTPPNWACPTRTASRATR